MKFKAFGAAVVAACLLVPAVAGAHELFDHAAPGFTTGAPSTQFRSGGDGAKWEFVASFPTGNPHTDIDFFTQKGEIFASVGTLAIGPNAGGQTLFQMTQGGEVKPKFLGSHPSAACISNPANALGLQHDVEASPKGAAILNTDVTAAVRRDTQIVIDATDADGRCHDQGDLGLAGAPQGGLEILDVADPAHPKEIGLTSHIGEAHTVNIDPKRPHIAYAVSSDSVGVNAQGVRANETGTSYNLDGFEVVDLSSCMNFPAGATLQQKRDACRPQVFRYRYPTVDMANGHTNKTNGIYGCHELEVYPDDRLTCGGGSAMIMLDMAGAFDDKGTPADFTDDKPKGTPLPCAVRASSTAGPFTTGAMITDCVTGLNDQDLRVPEWLKIGSPSLTGVQHIGSAFHPGRESATGAVQPKFDSTKDIDFDHEAELTHSGKFVLATDERGGGVLPPGAACSPANDIKQGNGGVHAYRVDKLLKSSPANAEAAHVSYAQNSKGERAIYRAPIRTQAQDSLCTAHVFHQIPGQNRIFMGWYSQGTQVVDYFENPDGTLEFKEAGWFIPANADEWVSAIFKVERNSDGTFTYWGATGDFNVGNAGRNAVDVYKVTLPAPPVPPSLQRGVGRGFAPAQRHSCLGSSLKIGRRSVGRLRLGDQYATTVQRLGNPRTRKGRVFRYCVTGASKRERVLALFDSRNAVRLLVTSAANHRIRGLGRGKALRSLRKRYRALRRIGRGLYRASGRSSFVIGTRRGRISFIAVADARLLAQNGRQLRAYLKLARLR